MNGSTVALSSIPAVRPQADILALLTRMNRGGKDSLIVPSDYLEVVVTKR